MHCKLIVLKLSLTYCILLSINLYGQKSPGKPIVCYGSNINIKSHNPSIRSNNRTQVQLADIVFSYENVPAEALSAFEYAGSLWENELSSPYPIRISVQWVYLSGGALATTSAFELHKNFSRAPIHNTWYPIALAEKLSGKELNKSSEPDIIISINQAYEWYYGIDGKPPLEKYDLVSIVLHEIAHGLGFSSSAKEEDEIGALGLEKSLYVYDLLVEGKDGSLSSLHSPSSELLLSFTSNNLYLNSPTASSANNGEHPRIFAPDYFITNSSISHLDEYVFPNGSMNSLMSPTFDLGESVHFFGEILIGVLMDLGWGIEHKYDKDLIRKNPSNGHYIIAEAIDDIGSLKVTDISGKLVERDVTIDLADSITYLDLRNASSGVYILTFSIGKKVFKKRLINISAL